MQTGSAPVYTDFQSMAALRSEAQANPDQALDEVASQFESLFVQMMLKSMRDATVDGGLFDSNQLDSYQQMFDQQLALELSSQGGVGLADMLVQQMGDYLLLGGEEREAEGQSVSDVDAGNPLQQAQRQVMQSLAMRAENSVAAESASSAGVGSRAEQAVSGQQERSPGWNPESPLTFIQEVWQYANVAAAELGVDPGVLVAQSALETGWGKKISTNHRGESSFNLFNIKAGESWGGAIASVSTLEFRDGLAAMEKAAFRAYDSLAASFADYVGLLKSSPRYQKALDVAGDSQKFLQELQHAGYATDPRYAEKVLGILNQENYKSAMAVLKNF